MAETSTKTCRICLEEIQEDAGFYSLYNDNDLMLYSKLLDFLPEFDLSITQNPVACKQCTIMIDNIHQFKQLCIQNESILKNQRLCKPFPVVEEVTEKFKIEFIEHPIKSEFHVADIEESDRIFCYVCDYSTDDKKSLTDHLFTHRFKCNQCSYTTPDNFLFMVHKEIHSNINPFQCNICNYICIETHSFNEHVCADEVKYSQLIAKNDNLYECFNCGFQTNSKINLEFHVSTHKKMCNLCNYCTNSEIDLSSHMLMHKTSPKREEGDEVVKCEKCRFSTSKREYLHKHMIRMHNREKLKHKCKLCNFANIQKSRLIAHAQTHIHEKLFRCELCNSSYNNMEALKIHLCEQSGRCPFKCDKCDYKTYENWRLIQHQRLHTGEKPFKCSLCDYGGNELRHLKLHMLKHTGELPFNCDKCDYKTVYKKSLINHQRLHSEEKPFKCKLCSYSSRQLRTLQVHMYKHSGEWPFKCDECDFKTENKNKFVNHKKVHSGEKPFKCNLCNYRCVFKSSLKVHERRHLIAS